MNLVSQDPAYNRLKDHLITSTGLSFYADRDYELTDLIGQRLADLRLRDCSSYADFFVAGPEGEAEMDLVVSKLTIGETSFFRDPDQFAAIRDVILPDILERSRESKHLRIWSAGCSTGAEPYSLAIMLARDLADLIAGWKIDIYATDLNRGFLTAAAKGTFRAWALRSVSDEVRRECFTADGATWTIHDRYKQGVSFHYMNLVNWNQMDSEFLPHSIPWNRFDMILCRNVMIYFTPEVNRRLVGKFHEALEEGGWLVVGASEHNQENYRAFQAVSTGGAKLYHKTDSPTVLEMQPGPARPSLLMDAFHPLPPPAELRPAELLPPEPSAAAARSPDPADLELLRRLVDRGDWDGAAACGERLKTQDRFNAAIYFYQALIFENRGIPMAAERALRQAIYLDRNFAMAHYHLGLALKRDHQMPAAARSFGNVLRILDGVADQTLIMDGAEVSAAELKDLAGMHLESSGERTRSAS